MNTRVLWFLSVAFSTIYLANAHEPVLYIVRHGEEPKGVSWGLSAKGFMRSHAIAAYFTRRGRQVDEIYAPIPDDKSGRAFQTCEPTASALKQKVYLFHKREETEDLALDLKEELEEGNSVLVCWTNRNIKSIADALGIKDAPKWDPNVFDELWEITLHPKPTLHIEKHVLPEIFDVPREPYFTEEYGVVKTLQEKYPEEYESLMHACHISSSRSCVYKCDAHDFGL